MIDPDTPRPCPCPRRPRLPILPVHLVWLALVLGQTPPASADRAGDAAAVDAESSTYADLSAIPEIRDFLVAGTDRVPDAAPDGVRQFARLVGVWDARQEVRKQDGSWVESAPALWIWKLALGGYATQDLWLHTEDHLPSWFGDLGRPYMLTGLRVYDAASNTWHIAWAANGGDDVQGPDFGVLTGVSEPVPEAERTPGCAADRMVLTGTSEYGTQRITFSDITADSFTWTSEYSSDGSRWAPIMRVRATRRTLP